MTTLDVCYFCETKECQAKNRKRFVTLANYKQLGIDDDKIVEAENRLICQACWLSKTVKPYTKSCAAPDCTTSRRKINKLYYAPVDSLDQDGKRHILGNMRIEEDSRICQKCYHMVISKRKELANQNQETNRESIVVDGEKGETDKNLFENYVQSATHDGKDPSVTAATRTGRPKVSYNDASEANKRRMKAEAKTAIAELVHKCDKISKGCSQQLLSAVIEKTPLRNVETKNIEAQKLDNMMNDLCKSYDKENQRSSDKIRLLNTIACHFTNKELKRHFLVRTMKLPKLVDMQNSSDLVSYLNLLA
jgi:hypothetical protein